MRGWRLIGSMAFTGLTIALIASCSSTQASTKPAQATDSPARHSSITSPPALSRSRPAATPVPSPWPPPFGYCGGLRSVSDARYIVRAGAGVALVQAEVADDPTPIPGVNPAEQSNPLRHVRTLAGTLPDGPLSAIDAPPLPRRRYLILVGDTGRGGYFAAFGDYGIYTIHGHNAYRACNDFSGDPGHLVREGVTSVRGLTHLFSRALR